MSRIRLFRPSPFTPLTSGEPCNFLACKVSPQGAAPLLPKDSATGSEEGSAAGVAAVSEGASSTSFCLGGMVTSDAHADQVLAGRIGPGSWRQVS